MLAIQRKSLFKILIIVFILVIYINSFSFSESNIRKRVIMVILNRLTLEDLDNMDNLRNLIEDGSIGIMNTRGLYGYKGAECYATINASARVNATYSYSKSFNLINNVSNIYNRRFGIIPEGYQIINSEINKLIKLNNKNNFNAKIGALGDALHRKGLKTAVFGNSDTADNIIRANCLIAIDSRGFIDYGNVDNIIINDDSYPYGMRTDYVKILKELNDLGNKASFIIIETGDLDRLYLYRENLTDKMYFLHRKNILKKADEFIGDLVNKIDKSTTRLIIISPNMGDDKIKNANKLTPLIFWGDGIPKGILFSKTTRRKGIVSNIDIAPSITKYLGVNFENFLGTNVEFKASNNNLSFIKQLNSKILFVSNVRKQSLRIYIISELIFISMVILILFFKVLLTKKLSQFIQILLLLIIAMPLVFLGVSSYNIMDTWEFVKYVVIILFFIIMLVVIFNPIHRLQLVSVLTYLTIFIDLLTGCKLAKSSIIGYDPTIGARYYGIGNELVGILLFSLFIIISGIFKNKQNNLLLFLLLIFNIYLLESSNFGANLGGSLTLIFTSVCMLYHKVLRAKKNFFNVVKIFVMIILVFLVTIVIDTLISTSTTHIESFLNRILLNDINYIYNIILRKLLMNIKLFKVSIWGESLRVNIILFVFLLITQKDTIKRVLTKNKNVVFGFKCSILSAIFGLLLNDSGVVMAALILLLNVSALTYLTILQIHQNKRT